MRFDGKVVFVTGGASGLGAAAAERFAGEGARVAVADIDEDGARRVANVLPDALAVTVDTASPSSVQRAVRRVVDHYGRIDVVFNNAKAGIIGLTRSAAIEYADRNIRSTVDHRPHPAHRRRLLRPVTPACPRAARGAAPGRARR
jgi:NAD(P)-dependent dehydrogenase (short-subunit alcohol dehydrogenase family)